MEPGTAVLGRRHAGGVNPHMPKYPASMTPVSVRPASWAEYRDLWRRAEALEILSDFPLHLDIELTSQCNLRCKMCWQNGHLVEEKQGMMTDKLFKRVIAEGLANGMSAIKLQSRGESALHPRIAKLARHAKEAGVKDIQLTTNGTLFVKRDRFEDLIASGLDVLVFSIDKAHDESAREIYGDDAPDVPAIVHEAIAIRRALGRDRPIIRIQTHTAPGETKEAKLAEIRAEFPDADEYRVNYLWNPDYEQDAIEGLSRNYELMACAYLWTRLLVFWNGDVTLCCKDYNGKLVLGNANKTPLKDIWLGARMMELRRLHVDGLRRTVPICNHCEVCTRPLAAEQSPAEWIFVANDQRPPRMRSLIAEPGS